MNCQENCPYVMPCGNCFACSEYPNCLDKPNDTMCDECKQCFNRERRC